jgi:hypothetical protein
MPDERSASHFEEQSALEELERLHQAIEQSRRKRREASDAFDSFVRSFGSRSGTASAPANIRAQPRTSELPALAPSGSLPPSHVQTVAPAAPAADPLPGSTPPREVSTTSASEGVPATGGSPPPSSSEPRHTSSPSEALHAASPSETAHTETRTEPVVPAALTQLPERESSMRWWLIAAAAVVVVAMLAWRVFAPGPGDDSPAPAPAASAAPAPVAAAPPPPDAPPPEPVTELATERRVWVRVTVDGERVLERELEAGVRIPLEAKETIVVRAGDAGAIRLTIAGKDQGVFGPDGIAVTRTFPVPSASPR